MNTDADIVVIGGGIVGLSTAMQLLERYPGRAVWVLEKEARLASHQTGRNSGVVHAGVYYAPGSLKARFCREGHAAPLAFSHEHGLPVEQCGKLMVGLAPTGKAPPCHGARRKRTFTPTFCICQSPAHLSSSSNAFASFKSAVSKPSVNQP